MDYLRKTNTTISNNDRYGRSRFDFQPTSSNLDINHHQSKNVSTGKQLDQSYNILLVEGSLNIVANLPILVFLLYNHKKLLVRHTTKYFINIQVIHIVVGVEIILTFMFNFNTNIVMTMTKILLTEMIFSMLMLNCDRYFAISRPFIYQKVTSKKVYLLIAVSWIIMLVELVLFIALNLKIQVVLNLSLTILMTVSITVLTYSNIVIWFIARKHIHYIAQNSVNEPIREIIRRKQLKKSTLSCMVIVGSFVVLYTPSFIHNITVVTTDFKARFSNAFTTSILVISLLNGIVDPLLYVMFNNEIKSEIVNSLPFLKRRRIIKVVRKTQNTEM